MSEPRVALVSGGGRGIGAAITLALAGDGFDVAINYRRDEDAARQTAQLVEAMGRRAEIERVWRTHALGAFALCQLVVPSMRTRPRGDVVFISSAATKSMSGYSSPYNMAKAAMEALAHTLAKEELPNGIHVNIVAPGLVDTDMGRRLAKAVMGAGDDIHSIKGRMPFGHVCSPEEVADVVAWVVSDAARYVNNQCIGVDGGAY